MGAGGEGGSRESPEPPLDPPLSFVLPVSIITLEALASNITHACLYKMWS